MVGLIFAGSDWADFAGRAASGFIAADDSSLASDLLTLVTLVAEVERGVLDSDGVTEAGFAFASETLLFFAFSAFGVAQECWIGAVAIALPALFALDAFFFVLVMSGSCQTNAIIASVLTKAPLLAGRAFSPLLVMQMCGGNISTNAWFKPEVEQFVRRLRKMPPIEGPFMRRSNSTCRSIGEKAGQWLRCSGMTAMGPQADWQIVDIGWLKRTCRYRGKTVQLMSIAAAPAYAGSVFFKSQLLSQFQRILNVDVDLNAKLDEWKRFYNLARPHGAFKGKAPYDILRVSYNHHEDVSSPFEIIQQRSF